MKIAYVAETSLTNKSAYTHHVIKMCDAFSQQNNDVTLFIPNLKKNLQFRSLEKKFILFSKNRFELNSVINKKTSNFFLRILFGLKTAIKLKNKNYEIILTRSLIVSLFLSLFKTYHFLEIHSELKSFTKFYMLNLNFINSKFIIKKILISKELNKIFKIKKENLLILHDGSDPKNFTKFKKIKEIKTATYIGSFYKGRGIELLYSLAKKFKNINFKLYGQVNYDYKSNLKNLNIFNYVEYSKIPSILATSDLLLMPYEKKVFVRAKNINTANYCSPLKMFDYLASGKIIISSNLSGISEVIKDGYNGYLVNNFDVLSWEKKINEIIKKKRNYQTQKNALRTAKKYSWNNRVKKIIIEYKKNNIKRSLI
tara:strand:+ start:25539 stop:26645 length:1107 start_codon:yes stop_codon:yes gene_type:complete